MNKSEINKFKIMVQNYEDYELMRRCSEDEIKLPEWVYNMKYLHLIFSPIIHL